MKFNFFILLAGFMCTMARCQNDDATLYPKNAVRFSQDFLLAIKTEQPYEAFRDTLKKLDLDALKAELKSPEQKLAFWINAYNALVQAKIRDNKDAFSDRAHFFHTADQIIGGTKLSLDDIETGILRRRKRKNATHFIATFKVDRLDPRIHFTLNCGATSCPPVAFYSPEKLNEELAAAETSFVTQTSSYDAVSNTVTVSELFSWYADDFGGKQGIYALLERLRIIPVLSHPEIRYSPYNWNLDTENY